MVSEHHPTCFNPHDAMQNGKRMCTCGVGFRDEIFTIAELERREILRAMRVTGGSVIRSARMLGIGRATLYRRLEQFGIGPEGWTPVDQVVTTRIITTLVPPVSEGEKR